MELTIIVSTRTETISHMLSKRGVTQYTECVKDSKISSCAAENDNRSESKYGANQETYYSI